MKKQQSAPHSTACVGHHFAMKKGDQYMPPLMVKSISTIELHRDM